MFENNTKNLQETKLTKDIYIIGWLIILYSCFALFLGLLLLLKIGKPEESDPSPVFFGLFEASNAIEIGIHIVFVSIIGILGGYGLLKKSVSVGGYLLFGFFIFLSILY